jgi:hypothetical protein
MPLLDVSTDFADNGATPGWGAHHALPTPRGRRYSVGGIILTLLVLPLLAASLAVAAWLLWLLANGVLGRQATLVGLVSLVTGGAALSWHSGRSFTGSLIVVGFGGLSLLICGLYGLAGYALIFGG